jgi:hypothetical protein
MQELFASYPQLEVEIPLTIGDRISMRTERAGDRHGAARVRDGPLDLKAGQLTERRVCCFGDGEKIVVGSRLRIGIDAMATSS